MSEQPLKSARQRLENAKRKIGDLQAAVSKFFELKPYALVVDKNTKPGYHLHKIELFAPIPDEWPIEVAHIVSDLRSPLDYAVGRVMELDPAALVQVRERNQSLPVSRDAKALKKELRQRKILAVYPKLSDFILKTVKPYRGGNSLICNLDTLNNSKKHRDLHAIGMASPDIRIENLYIRSASHFAIPARGYQRHLPKEGIVLFETSPDANFKGDLKVALNVALTKIDVFDRQPVTRSLSEIANEVDRLLGEFDRAFFG